MSPQANSKRRRLQRAGLLQARSHQVVDPLFRELPEFFDARDLLQVRYELLRAHLVSGDRIRAVCARYGVSRQTFYNLLEKFEQSGTAGLLPERPGPRGPWKLTTEVLTFARQQLRSEPEVSGAGLSSRIEANFGVVIHKRTAERLLEELRVKKNS